MSIKPPSKRFDEKVPRPVGNRIGKEILTPSSWTSTRIPRQILFPANRPTLKLTKSIPLSQFSTPSSIVSPLVSLEWNIFLSGTKGESERERERGKVCLTVDKGVDFIERNTRGCIERRVEKSGKKSGMENAHNGITGSNDAIGK